MAMTEKQIIRFQAEVNRHMRDRLVKIHDRCHKSIEYSKKNGYQTSKVAQDMLHETEEELAYLDSKGAELDSRTVGSPEGQMKLVRGYDSLKSMR